MTQVQPTSNESVKSESEVLPEQHPAQTPIAYLLQKLSRETLLLAYQCITHWRSMV